MDEDLKKLTEQLDQKMTDFEKASDEHKKALEGKASSEEVAELKGLMEKHGEDAGKIQEQLDSLDVKLKDITAKPKVEGYGAEFVKSFKEMDKKALRKEGGSFTGVIKGYPAEILKAAGNIVINDNLGAFDLDTAVILPMRVPGVDKAPDRATTILDLFPMGITSSNQVTFVQRTARTDGTASVAEAAQYGQSDFHWTQSKALVEKIGTYIKISNESLEDWPFVLSEIRTELFGMLRRKLEDQIWSGTGTTPQLDGITNNAVAYTDTSLNTSIASPNNFDAIRAAVNQLAVNNYIADFVLLNPTDVAKMDMTKDSNNQYIIPPFATANGMRIAGLPIISSNKVTAGNVMVGDSSIVTIYMRRNIDIRMWDQDSTDPEYDLKTITGSLRATIKFPSEKYSGIIYDAINDITTLIGV